VRAGERAHRSAHPLAARCIFEQFDDRRTEAAEFGVAQHDGRADAAEATALYRDARAASWSNRNTVAAACAGDPGGPEAMAAVARLDRQAEGIVRRQTAELRAVRREVDSFIR